MSATVYLHYNTTTPVDPVVERAVSTLINAWVK